jgi:hypothetical protein
MEFLGGSDFVVGDGLTETDDFRKRVGDVKDTKEKREPLRLAQSTK